MKKNLLIAAIAAMGVVSASAQTAVYLTGATAFRSAVNATLFANFADKIAACNTDLAGRNDASTLKFTNIPVNGGSFVDLYVKWSGSEAGIRSVASPVGTNAITETYYKTTVAAASTNAAYSYSTSNNTEAKKGDICFSDTKQEVSNFQGRGKDGRTYATLTGYTVGVVPFSFWVNKGAPISDINVANFKQLAGQGEAPLHIFTGNASDSNSKVWLTGRDPFSGSRVSALVIGNHGYNTPVIQWQPIVATRYLWTNTAGTNLLTNISASTPTNTGTWSNIVASNFAGIVSFAAYSSNNSFNLSVPAANNGESSGSTLIGYLTNSCLLVSAAGGKSRGTENYFLSYVSAGDAFTKIKDGIKPINFCGVNGRWGNTNEIAASGTNIAALDSGYTNIITGKYPFWSYEWIFFNPSTVTVAASNTVTWLTNKIASYDSTNPLLGGNIAIKDMKVRRTADGGNQLK
jgi:hypothetical protein